MNENTIDFQWSAGPGAQPHWVDQVLMNINVNLMKVQREEGEKGGVQPAYRERLAFKS